MRYFDSENFPLMAEREVGFEKFQNEALSEQLSFKCYFVNIFLKPTDKATASFKNGLVCRPIPTSVFWL